MTTALDGYDAAGLTETAVANATRNQVANAQVKTHVFQGAHAEPAWTKILSPGHTATSRLNSEEAENMTLLPEGVQMKNKLIGWALVLSAVLVPAAGTFGMQGVNRWMAERKATALRIEAEAAVKVQQEAAAVRVAAEQAIAVKRNANLAKAPAVLTALLEKGVTDTSIPATPAASMFTAESMAQWSKAFWAFDKGTVIPEFVQRMAMSGAWTTPAQYVSTQPHTMILTAVVDDNGTRKVWVGLMNDNTGAGFGSPKNVYAVIDIPGTDNSKLYVAPDQKTVSFQKFSPPFMNALATPPAAVVAPATQVKGQ